jgi:Na+-transporting NADH:ubiquinone oxidoreductase subunit A
VSLQIRIRDGLDLPLPGPPVQRIETANAVRTVAVIGTDYVGLRPKMLVQTGDRIKLGDPLFVDKRDSAVAVTAPGSGTVAAVNRGDRRVLLSVVIALDDSEARASDPAEFSHLRAERPDAATVRAALCRTGLWTALRTRPFSRVPLSTATPRSLFVTAIDTQPLAANPATIVAADRDAFEVGLAALACLPEKHVYLCTAPDWTGPQGDGARIRHAVFSGPHPAGLVGTHIHHLDPVGPDRTAWHIGYQDVIAIGKLFGEGRLAVERTVALGGAGFRRPRLVTTRLGAHIDELVAGELAGGEAEDEPARLLSGSVLGGRTADGVVSFLGRYHLQVTALPEGGRRRLFGWLPALSDAPGFGGLLTRLGRRRKARPMTTALNGRPAAIVPVEAFEHVMPLDILPVPLLRALLIRDTEQAQALGCLELDPEDLALTSFVCPGKNDYGAALKANLEQIEREG